MTDNSFPIIKQKRTGVPGRIVLGLIVVAVLLCFSPLGLRLFDWYNAQVLSSDARKLLEKAGIRAEDIRAEMVPGSRAGFVTFTVTEAQAKALRKALGMKALTGEKSFQYNACTSLPAFKERSWELYVVYNKVGLSSGRTFAPIRFYFKRATGDGCLEVTYGYS